MPVLWFGVVAGMLVLYAVLDGFDLGAGAIQLFVARGQHERGAILAAAGPFWDANEIWLALAGGAIYCAFPAVYSSPGFYPLAVTLLWLLILRGIGTEFRTRTKSGFWKRILDISLGISSLLLAVALGAAVGCVIRGVPPTGGSRISYLFPVLCGLTGLAVLTLQSAAWMALKTNGELQTRSRKLASGLWWIVLCCYAGVMAASLAVQPHLLDNLQTYSWISLFAVVALAGLMGMRLCMSVGFDLGVFASASCLIVGLLASVAAGQYPYLFNDGALSLTVENAGLAHWQLGWSAIWWAPAFVVAIGYNVAGRVFGAKVHALASVRPQPIMTAGD